MLPPSNQTSCEKFWSNQDEVSTLHRVSPTECSWKPRVEWLEQPSEDSEKWYRVDWGRKPELKIPPSHAWDSWIFSARVSRPRLEGSPKLGTVHQTERALWDALLSGLKTGKGHPTSQREWGKFHLCFLFVRFLMQAPGQPCRDGVAKATVAVQAPIIQGGNPCLWPKELSPKYGETPYCFFPLSSLPALGPHGSLVGE